MTYRSKVQCDACHVELDAPEDGGFPNGWCEINIKPSLRGKENAHKRKRYHVCAKCMDSVLAALARDVE